MQIMGDNIQTSIEYIKGITDRKPIIGIILGSGLGGLSDEIENKIEIPYEEIPHFPQTTVLGHAGKLILGDLRGRSVMAMKGRFHYYEGHSMRQVTYPVRLMQAMGIKNLIVTNAAGGLNDVFETGDLMLIEDHINFMGFNPLIGPNDEALGTRFPVMNDVYDDTLRSLAHRVGEKLNIALQTGVYVAVTGPSFETTAELKMFKVWGADAVGMSTVPEVLVARHAGMKVMGISCITNVPLKKKDEAHAHLEVLRVADAARTKLIPLVKGIIEGMN